MSPIHELKSIESYRCAELSSWVSEGGRRGRDLSKFLSPVHFRVLEVRRSARMFDSRLQARVEEVETGVVYPCGFSFVLCHASVSPLLGRGATMQAQMWVPLWLWLPALAWTFSDRELIEAVRRGYGAHLLQSGDFNISTIRTDDWYNETLLHLATFATYRPLTFEVVYLLLQAWPAGAQAKDVWGRTPLHTLAAYPYQAVRGNYLEETVSAFKLLVDAWPDGILATDRDGHTPDELVDFCPLLLQIACNETLGIPVKSLTKNRAVSLECSDLGLLTVKDWVLFLSCGGDPKAKDRGGRMPLHTVAANCYDYFYYDHGYSYGDDDYAAIVRSSDNVEETVSTLKLLVDAWPDGMLATDSDGHTPDELVDVCRLLLQIACNETVGIPVKPLTKNRAVSLECSQLGLLKVKDLKLF